MALRALELIFLPETGVLHITTWHEQHDTRAIQGH